MAEDNLYNNANNKVVFYLHAAAAFQYLHAGIHFKIFKQIHKNGPLDFFSLQRYSKLSDDSLSCLLFGLVSLDLLQERNTTYTNSKDIEYFFQNDIYHLLQSMSNFQSKIVYQGINEFVPSLQHSKNLGLKHISKGAKTLYQTFGRNNKIKKVFYKYMEDYSAYAIKLLLDEITFENDNLVLDIGGGMGINAISIAKKFPKLNILITDLGIIKKDVDSKLKKNKTGSRVKFSKLDIFKGDFPLNADSILFIHQLVIWSKEENIELLSKAHNSLKPGGRVIIFSSIADDNKGPLMAALDSVYFKAVATGRGTIYNWEEYEKMLTSAGFSEIEKIPCNSWTPHGIIVATK